MSTPSLAHLFEQEHIEALQRLEKFLIAEFPLEFSEGDMMVDVAIKIMKDMKATLSSRTASEMVFGNTQRF